MVHLEQVLQKEMTRKEFLTRLGFGLVSIIGMGAVVRLFFGKSPAPAKGAAPMATYGNTEYGGSSRARS